MHADVFGSGDEVVLLHGWGMHGGVWGEFQQQLSENYKVHIVDLPGYGFSKKIDSDFSFDSVTHSVEEYIDLQIENDTVLVAWSLAGLIVFNLLKKRNEKIRKVVFIATTPCFTQKEGWPHGLEQAVFDGFSSALEKDYKKTLQRFLSLQTRGSDMANRDLRKLKENLNSRGEPNLNALKQGLKILSQQDLRLQKISSVPALVLLGEKDTLVPVSVKTEFKKMLSNVKIDVLAKVGHAPFITQAKKCSASIKKFIDE